MLTLHHLGQSQSERIVWLCEELEIPYEFKRYSRDPNTGQAPPEYKKLHPIGMAPTITDGDVVLAESVAVVEYILAKYNGQHLTVAADNPNFADYLFWFHFSSNTMLPSEMMRMAPLVEGAPVSAVGKRADLAYPMMEKHLSCRPYFAGPNFTVADIMMTFVLTRLRKYAKRSLSPFPSIRTYLSRVGERDAYRRAMEKSNPGEPLDLVG
jgi:glutathione S-transferase